MKEQKNPVTLDGHGICNITEVKKLPLYLQGLFIRVPVRPSLLESEKKSHKANIFS